jgi:hypothetical protein
MKRQSDVRSRPEFSFETHGRRTAACIYVADNADLVAEHAERSGFPATTVTEIGKIIDPTTANN